MVDEENISITKTSRTVIAPQDVNFTSGIVIYSRGTNYMILGHLGNVAPFLGAQRSSRHKNCKIGGLIFDNQRT